MKPTYFLGLDTAKHKIRAALSGANERLLFEKDLPATGSGLCELLAQIKQHLKTPEELLVLIEATGLLHLPWSAALTRAGYAVAVINPLMARRLYRVENSLRDNKTDPIDARGLCAIGALHGTKLLGALSFWFKATTVRPAASPNGPQSFAQRVDQFKEDLSKRAGVELERSEGRQPFCG